MASREHKQALLEAMNRTKLPVDTTVDQLVSLVTSVDIMLVISFTDKELPPRGANHNRPLYVTLESRKKWISVVLIGNLVRFIASSRACLCSRDAIISP